MKTKHIDYKINLPIDVDIIKQKKQVDEINNKLNIIISCSFLQIIKLFRTDLVEIACSFLIILLLVIMLMRIWKSI